jgi:pimeloyl-ACP methyl ester carboxylesterase
MKAFACIYFPHASAERLQWFVQLQRRNVTPETAVRTRAVCDNIDVLALLPFVRAQALVTHSRNDQVVPISNGMGLASLLPNGRFLALDGSNHVILSDDPAADAFASAVDQFLAPA